jgi:prophage regulatory protein
MKPHKTTEHHNKMVIKAGLIRLPQVLELIPVSKSTWWAGVASGRFPKAYKISPKCTAWKASEIYALIDQLSVEEV